MKHLLGYGRLKKLKYFEESWISAWLFRFVVTLTPNGCKMSSHPRDLSSNLQATYCWI